MYELAAFACWNMGSMYDPGAADAGIWPHVRIGSLRLLEYGANVRLRHGRCRNNAPMYEVATYLRWNLALMYDSTACLCRNVGPMCDPRKLSVDSLRCWNIARYTSLPGRGALRLKGR